MAPSRIEESEISSDYSNDSVRFEDEKLANLKARLTQNVRLETGTPRAWKGSDLDEAQYVINLSEEERLEVETAARDYIGRLQTQAYSLLLLLTLNLASEGEIGRLSPTSFPLPTLGPCLRLEKARLHEGLGFFVLRGLEPWRYDSDTNIVIYVGISSYIGNKRAIQYPGGPVLSHVIDLSSDEDREKHRGKWIGTSNQNAALPFHTDHGHTLCLYSIHSVPNGGRSHLASAKKVLDTLYRERPDLVAILKADWEWDTFADTPTGYDRPLLFEERNRTILNYQRRPLVGLSDFPRRAGLKPLTDQQIEALEVLEALASRFRLTFKLRTGDVLYVNNLALLHGREAFRCEHLNGCRRHLLRMWLKDEECDLPLPGPLDAVVRAMYKHDVGEEEFPWSLAPVPYILSP